MKRHFFKIRFAAIILMAAGYGWAGGDYIPANSSIIAYLFQFIIITALMIMGVKFLSITENERRKSNWSIIGLSIFSVLSLLINIVNIIRGVYSYGLISFSSHYNVADLAPIALLIIGNGLWIISILRSTRRDTNAKYLLKNQYNIL